MSEWISVEDRLPLMDEYVLIWDGKDIEKGHRIDLRDGWYWTHYDYLETHGVTHWMPLPDKPAID